MIDGISAVTRGTHEMPASCPFYRALGFEVLPGGPDRVVIHQLFEQGTSYLNLMPSCRAVLVLVGAAKLRRARFDALYVPCARSRVLIQRQNRGMPNGVSTSAT